MQWLPLTIGIAGAVCVALPGLGLFIGMGLCILAVAAGVRLFRGSRVPASRLLGAMASVVGTAALGVAIAKYTLALLAVDHMQRML